MVEFSRHLVQYDNLCIYLAQQIFEVRMYKEFLSRHTIVLCSARASLISRA